MLVAYMVVSGSAAALSCMANASMLGMLWHDLNPTGHSHIV
jgi:hypothetical protein